MWQRASDSSGMRIQGLGHRIARMALRTVQLILHQLVSRSKYWRLTNLQVSVTLLRLWPSALNCMSHHLYVFDLTLWTYISVTLLLFTHHPGVCVKNCGIFTQPTEVKSRSFVCTIGLQCQRVECEIGSMFLCAYQSRAPVNVRCVRQAETPVRKLICMIF